MFREMRRVNQKLSDTECIQILQEESRGILSVLGENDYPYGIPLNYVFHENKLIFHSAIEGHMYESIKKHDKVSFCVINAGEKVENEWWYIFKSVILFGKITEITDDKERIEKLRFLGNKYFPSEKYTEDEIKKSFVRTLVLEMNIEHMSGKIVTEK